MSSFPQRHAIPRAEFFLRLAIDCPAAQKNEFEAFLEASIIFGRTSIHRLKSEFEHHPGWQAWFSSLKGNPAIEFFREHRDITLKESSPKVGQRIGVQPATRASEFYFFAPSEPATTTVRIHLNTVAQLIQDAQVRFSNPSAP